MLPPGASTTVHYDYHMGPGMGGPHRFKILLRTDSPETPEVELTLIAVSG